MKNFQVGKNLGNHRDRSYRHPDRENDDQRDTVAVGAGERGADEPGTECQSKDKRYSRTHDGQPTHFAALFTGKQLAGLGAGKEHQQEQTEPVNEIQNICLLPDGLPQARRPGQSANQRGTQHHAGEDLAHHLRLPQSDEKVAEELCQPDQSQEYEENRGQIGVGHGRHTLPGVSDACSAKRFVGGQSLLGRPTKVQMRANSFVLRKSGLRSLYRNSSSQGGGLKVLSDFSTHSWAWSARSLTMTSTTTPLAPLPQVLAPFTL